jgi:hypothetical protein
MSIRLLILAPLLLAGAVAYAEAPPLSDAQIRRLIIQKSIESYPGNCPCPWNTDRAGRRCGKRSAYNRPGGAAPKCHEYDVTDEEVAEYRKRVRSASSVISPNPAKLTSAERKNP